MRKPIGILAVVMTVIGSLSTVILIGPVGGVDGGLELSVGEVSAEPGELTELTVTFNKARVFPSDDDGAWTETVLDDTPMNLSDLEGSGSSPIANLTLDEGRYTKVELHVDQIEAKVDGEPVDIFVPSGVLKVVGAFSVGSDSTATFEFDIRLVRRGDQNVYNLVPVIGKRVGPDKGGPDDKGGDGGGGSDNKGTLMMAIAGSKDRIDDFDHLNVTFVKARIFQAVNNSTESNWTEVSLDNVTVDLTNLTSTNETIVANLSLDAGNYTKIELYVSKVVSVVDGVEVDVKVPSGKLKIVGDFEVEANDTVEFVFGIHVVQKGPKTAYNLTPVIVKNQDDDD
ncbi:MAG: DUF4382 domain-containing protein [Thermoplasmata archaeon]|nr:DUF4382 domain-containing protein [Thermoplasmata archaeon]